MNIRKAELKDITYIIDFQINMAAETEELVLEEQIITRGVTQVFQDANKGCYYVCEDEGQIVASLLTTYEWSDWRAKTIIWLQSVYVKPEFRGRGIFKYMYLYIKEMVLNSQEYCGIKLYVDNSNETAKQVYSKLGMNNQHYSLFEWQNNS